MDKTLIEILSHLFFVDISFIYKTIENTGPYIFFISNAKLKKN